MAIQIKDANNVTQNVETVTDAAGNLCPVQCYEGQKATYAVTATGVVAASAATDIFTLTGSASKTIRVLGVWVTGTGTAITVDCLITKHTTANTGGTSSAATITAMDSNDAAATATAVSYTANPTVGTSTTVRSQKMGLAAASASATSPVVFFPFGQLNDRALVLRGTAQQMSVNLNGATITSPLIDITVIFTEE